MLHVRVTQHVGEWEVRKRWVRKIIHSHNENRSYRIMLVPAWGHDVSLKSVCYRYSESESVDQDKRVNCLPASMGNIPAGRCTRYGCIHDPFADVSALMPWTPYSHSADDFLSCFWEHLLRLVQCTIWICSARCSTKVLDCYINSTGTLQLEGNRIVSFYLLHVHFT